MFNLNHSPICNNPPGRTAPDANVIDSRPSIYVICLASYHKGILHGVWIDLTQDDFIIRDQIFDMLSESPTPGTKKYTIHDSRGFYGLKLNQYGSVEALQQIALLVYQYGILGAKVLAYYGGDFENAINALQGNYRGEYDSELGYAEALMESCYLYKLPKCFKRYVDYGKFQQDIFRDTYFSVSVNGTVHIFGRD